MNSSQHKLINNMIKVMNNTNKTISSNIVVAPRDLDSKSKEHENDIYAHNNADTLSSVAYLFSAAASALGYRKLYNKQRITNF